MSQPTIVTAFFDIGRSDWDNYSRSTDLYFERLEMLCHLKNKIILYTEHKFLPIIEDIKNRVKPDLIVEYEELVTDHKMLSDISITQQSDYYRHDLKYDYRAECNSPEYVYLMYKKGEYVSRAIDKHNITGHVAWIDAGYPRKLEDMPKSRVWSYDFPEKICLWAHTDYSNFVNMDDDDDIINFVKSGTVCVIGCHYVAPHWYWSWFQQQIDYCMRYLLHKGVVDDDQTLVSMAYCYKNNHEHFDIRLTKPHVTHDWFYIFQRYNKMSDSSQTVHLEPLLA